MRASRLSRTSTWCSRPLFPRKRKTQRVAADADVVLLHRREAVRIVLLGILFVSDADHRCFEQRNDRREDFFARQARACEIAADRSPDAGQGFRERDHAVEFRLVADLAPARVVAILLAAASVPTGCLEMPARIGRDPNIGIGRGNRQFADPGDVVAAASVLPSYADVAETAAPFHPSNAGPVVADVTQAGGFGRIDGIGGRHT